MFSSVGNSSSKGSPEARRVLASVADSVGDPVYGDLGDPVYGNRPQTKAHLGEKQRLHTEAKGAPWKFAKAGLWRLARQREKTSNFDRQACRAHPPIIGESF